MSSRKKNGDDDISIKYDDNDNEDDYNGIERLSASIFPVYILLTLPCMHAHVATI